jgi:hypothetical protein
MVKKKVSLILIFVIIITLAVLLLTRGDKDIRQIQKNLATIVSSLEKKNGETLITSLAKMQKLASFFSEDCRIEVGSPVSEIGNKDELISTASQLRQLVDNVEIKLSEVSVTLQNHTNAKSTFVATAFVNSSLLEREEIYPRQLEVTWEKIGRDWKIGQVKVIEILH